MSQLPNKLSQRGSYFLVNTQIKKIFCAAVLIISTSGIAKAQSGNDDLFKEMEAEAQTKPTASLGEFKLLLQSMNFHQRATDRALMDNRNFYFDGRVQYKNKFNWNQNTFHLTSWAEYGNQKDTYKGSTRFFSDRDRRRHFFELNEINWIKSWNSFDATLGKKVVKLGSSSIYTPSDRISPKELNDPFSPKDLGVWLASVGLYHEAHSLTLTAIPFFSVWKLPSPSSRWSGTGSSSSSGLAPYYNLTNDPEASAFIQTLDVKEEFPKTDFRNMQGLALFKTTINGWDFFVSSFHGYNAYPVVKGTEGRNAQTGAVERRTSTKIYVPVGNHSAGFSTTVKKFEFHGEGFYQYAYAGRDDQYFTYTLGSTYTVDDPAKKIFLERIDCTVDYVGEEITRRQDYSGLILSSESARPFKNNILGRFLFKYDEKFRFLFSLNFDLLAGGNAYVGGLEYKIRDGLIAKAHSEFFLGKGGTYYGNWDENDRTVVALEYTF